MFYDQRNKRKASGKSESIRENSFILILLTPTTLLVARQVSYDEELLFVATRAHAVLGAATATAPCGGYILEINQIGARRGMGGTALVHAVIQTAQERGAKLLTTVPLDLAAVEFWAHPGFAALLWLEGL